MKIRHGDLGFLAGNRSHLFRSPGPYCKSICLGFWARNSADALIQPSTICALSGTAFPQLYAASRATRDIAAQSESIVDASARRRLGTPTTVAAERLMNDRRCIETI